MNRDTFGYYGDGQWSSQPPQRQPYTPPIHDRYGSGPESTTGMGFTQPGHLADSYQEPTYTQPYANPGYSQPGYGMPGYVQPGYGGQTYQMVPQYAYPGVVLPPGYAPKSKTVAGVLALFLGPLGIHNFYLGKTSRGLIQLILTILGVVTAIIVVGVFVVLAVGLWTFVEAIMYFVTQPGSPSDFARDGQGMPLT